MKNAGILVGFAIFALLACSQRRDGDVAQKMKSQYSAITTKYKKLIEEVKSDSAYRGLLTQRKQDWEKLLDNYRDAESTDEVELIRSQVLIDLEKYDEAMNKLDSLIQTQSHLSNEARFQKVRILQSQKQNDEALKLFKKIDASDFKKGRQYYEVMLNFAFDAPAIGDRDKFSRQLLALEKWPEDMRQYKQYLYSNLSQIARQRGDLKEAEKVLEEGIEKLKDNENTATLESALNLVRMIGHPAPELVAETWINSRSPEREKLQDIVVVVDFWAPWCAPCRAVIPTIVQEYNRRKDDGLLVVGYTRLYGQYRDDIKNVGKVSEEEEIRLINQFIDRFNIEYPVAIAHNSDGFEKYFIRGIPTMIFIDRNGKVADFKIGSGNPEYIRDKIKQLLGKAS